MRCPEFCRCANGVAVAQCQQCLVAGDQHCCLAAALCGDQGAQHGLISSIGQPRIGDDVWFDKCSLNRQRVDQVVDVARIELALHPGSP